MFLHFLFGIVIHLSPPPPPHPKLLCYSLQCYDLTWYLLLVIDSTVLFLRVFFVLSASFAVLKTFIFAAMCV